jgi:glycogen debranching enzyme
MLTILDGSTFCVSDDLGDLANGTEGVFSDDTRVLSRCRLLVDGLSPLLLTSRVVDYFSATHYLRNAPTERLPPDTIFISRERFIGSRVTEHLVIRNESPVAVRFDVLLELGSDFADIFSVKAHDFSFGDPVTAAALPPVAPCVSAGPAEIVLEDSEDSGYATYIAFSEPSACVAQGVVYPLSLGPHEDWQLTFEVAPDASRRRAVGPPGRGIGTELEHVREALAAWKLRVPRLVTPSHDLQHAYERSIADLASLRLKGIEGIGELPAAGMPWFMTVFGRDTLITSLQTLLFGPELAIGALRSVAALQALEDDASVDAEPGKILHELRRGKGAQHWFPLYYGAVDSTPLFLILLSEVWRWTGDRAVVEELEGAARLALEWVKVHGDRDGDGFLEYERRTTRGLENQSWKDSWDSQRFHDGRFAVPPIAPAEAQGYAYDALRRCAELAREVWRDAVLAEELDSRASALQERFDAAFWVEERRIYALALDRDKQQVDALCSNIGHLLWSGIVPPGRVDAVVAALLGEELWSGWGVRTMGARESAYNPLSYHNGTVWPHDTALAAWGLANEGRHDGARLLTQSLIEATGYFDHSLPEVFAGFSRAETAFPVAYPTAARPQAWAAGAPVLCLTLLLGLRPERASETLVSDSPSPAPAWLEGTRLEGVRAFGRSWTVAVRNGIVEVGRME